MKKNMKIIMIMMIISLMCSIFTYAEDINIQPSIEEVETHWYDFLFSREQFVVTGGSVGSVKDIVRGTVMDDVYLTGKYIIGNKGKLCQKDGVGNYAYSNKLYLKFVDKLSSSSTYNIKTAHFTKIHSAGESFKYTISGIDTNKIPSSKVGRLFTIGAVHFACQDGKWVRDDYSYASSSTPLGSRTAQTTFTLISDTHQCERKFLRTECDGDKIANIYQAVWMDGDKCGEQKTYTKTCPDKCVNSKCVSDTKVGTRKCDKSNVYVLIWDGSKWEQQLCEQDGVGYCKSGICDKPDITPPADEPPVGGEGSNVCECSGEEFTIETCENGGEVVTQECDGCYMVDVDSDCEINEDIEPILGGSGSGSDNGGSDYEPFEPTELSWWGKFIQWIKEFFTF